LASCSRDFGLLLLPIYGRAAARRCVFLTFCSRFFDLPRSNLWPPAAANLRPRCCPPLHFLPPPAPVILAACCCQYAAALLPAAAFF
jgi:hypothetical protein